MKKEKASKIICIIFLYILIFQSVIQGYIKVFQYFDEMLAIISFLYIIFYIIKSRGKISVNKFSVIIFCFLIIITLIGLFANFKFGYQELNYVFADILVFWKFFLVYFGFELLTKDRIINYQKTLAKNIKAIVVFLLILTLLNYMFDIFPAMEDRYGISPNQLFFGHPTILTSVCVFLLVTLLYCEKVNKKTYVYIAIILLLILSTLRSKSIGFAIVAIVVLTYINVTDKKINTWKMFIIGIICLVVGYKQIYYYFIDDNTARLELLSTSIEIANDYFPTGTGFGTYGSYFSGQNYSPIYNMYDIDDVWGLREEAPTFISDSFWPMILGQFGYIGTFLYVMCICIIYYKIQKKYSTEAKNIYAAKIIALIYLLIVSIAESAFVNPLSIPLAIILAI